MGTRLCHFNIGLYQSLSRDWVINNPLSFIFWMFEPKPAVFMNRLNRSSNVNATLQFKAARWRSQGNKNNYFSRLLSFIKSSCTHLAARFSLLTHPLLCLLKSGQQRSYTQGRRSFRLQRLMIWHHVKLLFLFHASTGKRLFLNWSQFEIHCLVWHHSEKNTQHSKLLFLCRINKMVT